MSIKRNLVLNGSATFLHKAVLAGQHFILLPFFLSSWGAAVYGEWLSLSAIPVALALSNLGMGTAASNAFVLRYVAGDVKGASAAMRAGHYMLILATIMGTVIGFPVIFGLHYFGAFRFMEVPESTAISVVVLLGASSLINFHAYLQQAWFRGARRIHLVMYWEVILLVSKIIFYIFLLLAGKGMVWLASVDFGLSTLSFVFLSVVGKRLLPSCKLLEPVCRADMLSFLTKGIAFLMEPIRQGAHIQGTLLLTRLLLGPEAVAVIGSLRLFANSVAQVYNAVQTSILPEMQDALGRGSLHSALKLYQLSTALTLAVAVAGTLSLIILGPWLYYYWTSGGLNTPRGAWVMLGIAVATNALWLPGAGVFRAADKPESLAFVGIIAAFFGLVLGAVLAAPLGVNGMLLGIIFMEVIMVAYVLPASCKLIGQPMSRFASDIFDIRHDMVRLISRRDPKSA